MFDHMQARKGRYTQLPEAWGEEELASRMSLKRNLSRVLNDDVREAVSELARVTAEIGMLPTTLVGLTGATLEAAATARMAPLAPLAEQVQEAIGQALRLELAWEPVAVSD